MKNASHWLIVGYSFRDACVNDLLNRSWETRRFPPKILVVTNSDNLKVEIIEDAFGSSRGSARGLTNYGPDAKLLPAKRIFVAIRLPDGAVADGVYQ